MFWKLWKYELKMFFIEVIYLRMRFYYYLHYSSVPEAVISFMMIVSLLFTIMLFVVFILTFVMIIRTYQQSMFTKAGYLTMTLPTSSKMILLVKILNSALWFILSMIVIVLAGVLLAYKAGGFTLSELFDAFGKVISANGFQFPNEYHHGIDWYD